MGQTDTPGALGSNVGLGLDATEVDLWAEIHRLRAAVAGPEGYAGWQDAAASERVRRGRAVRALQKIESTCGEECFEYRRIALEALAEDERLSSRPND